MCNLQQCYYYQALFRGAVEGGELWPKTGPEIKPWSQSYINTNSITEVGKGDYILLKNSEEKETKQNKRRKYGFQNISRMRMLNRGWWSIVSGFFFFFFFNDLTGLPASTLLPQATGNMLGPIILLPQSLSDFSFPLNVSSSRSSPTFAFSLTSLLPYSPLLPVLQQLWPPHCCQIKTELLQALHLHLCLGHSSSR